MSTRPTAIVNLQDDAPNLSSLNMLIYGWPGCGKTPFAGTSNRALIMDCDGGGTLSARSAGSTADAVPVETYDKMTEVYEYLRDGKHSYRWVWWDGITLFQERTLIDELTLDAHMRNPNQDRWVPSKREYFVDHNRIMEMVRRFVELPINFGITAHVGTEYMTDDEGEERIMYMPAVQGKGMPGKVTGYMNVVGFMRRRARKGPRGTRMVPEIVFNSDGDWFARDRWHKLPTVMSAPTVSAVEETLGISSSRNGVRRPVKKAAKKRS